MYNAAIPNFTLLLSILNLCSCTQRDGFARSQSTDDISVIASDGSVVQPTDDIAVTASDDSVIAEAGSNGEPSEPITPSPLPQRVNGGDSVLPAMSLCETLRLANGGMGVFRVDQVDYESMESAGPGRLLARFTLTMHQSLATGTPERLEAFMPVVLSPDGETISGELSVGAGDEFMLLVSFQNKPEFESVYQNTVNPLFNHLTFIPMVDGEWRHPAWSGCGASTEELLTVVQPMFAYLESWSQDSQDTFECPGDRFALEPGSGSLQADCGR